MSIFENLISGTKVCIITDKGELITGEFSKWYKEFGSIVITLPCESCFLQIDIFKIDFVLEIV
jgi:hypothetical protein